MFRRRAASFIVAVVLLTAGFVAGKPATPAARASMSVVHLTSTFVLPTFETVRDTHFVWRGPSTDPVVRLDGTAWGKLDNIVIEVDPGFHATSAIEMKQGNAGGPLGNRLNDIRIGSEGQPGRFDYGMRWIGEVNGDSNTMTNMAVFGAGVASFALDNTQATMNTFRGVSSYDAPIGLRSQAGGTIECTSCRFVRSTTRDIDLYNGGGLVVTDVSSEGSAAFASVVSGQGGGGLTVIGGTWAWGPSAVGPTITGTVAFRTWVRLVDFRVTPLDGTNHGSIVGFEPAKVFLSNVSGIA